MKKLAILSENHRKFFKLAKPLESIRAIDNAACQERGVLGGEPLSFIFPIRKYLRPYR
jgi:hypothetical protein